MMNGTGVKLRTLLGVLLGVIVLAVLLLGTVVPVSAEKSCFTAETLVTLADGSLKPIGEIKIGDQVRGVTGKVTTVLYIETPRLGLRRLYSFNGGEAFTTNEHPLLTTDGWKSLNPEETLEENSDLHLPKLEVGDILVTANGPVHITSIESEFANPAMTVYNLVLNDDKDYSYYANGFVAMATYAVEVPIVALPQ